MDISSIYSVLTSKFTAITILLHVFEVLPALSFEYWCQRNSQSVYRCPSLSCSAKDTAEITPKLTNNKSCAGFIRLKTVIWKPIQNRLPPTYYVLWFLYIPYDSRHFIVKHLAPNSSSFMIRALIATDLLPIRTLQNRWNKWTAYHRDWGN